jgi:hypothetical protein
MMEVTVPYLLRCTAALMLLLAGPVFAQTADEAAISKLLGAVKRSGVTVIGLETLTDSLLCFPYRGEDPCWVFHASSIFGNLEGLRKPRA